MFCLSELSDQLSHKPTEEVTTSLNCLEDVRNMQSDRYSCEYF